MKKLIVDRIEEGFAVCECEDLSHIAIPMNNFSFEVKESMVITLGDDGVYFRDTAAEDEKRRKILELQKKLMKKSSD